MALCRIGPDPYSLATMNPPRPDSDFARHTGPDPGPDQGPDPVAPGLGSAGLGDTTAAGDAGLDDSAALDETVADVDVADALTRVDPAGQRDGADRDGPSTSGVDDEGPGFDPEAGRGAIANKTSFSGVVLNESGLFVVGGIAALAGITTVIFAAFLRTTPYVVAASIVAPPTIVWFILRWRKWLGGAPYFYRMLTTFGEHEEAKEVLDAHVKKREAKVRAKIARLEAERTSDPASPN